MLEISTSTADNSISMERRNYQRVSVTLFGRFMLEDKSEYACQITNMSPGNAGFGTKCPGKAGEHIVVYADHIGRFEGTISRIYADGFAMSVEASERKRDKLAAKLTWLSNQSDLGLPEDRRHDRIAPRNPTSNLVLEDGRTYPCRIIDLSLSGAAVKSDVKPAIGGIASLGSMRGRIVRHFDTGIAIEFFAVQERDSLAGFLNR